jgi:hypothetical protein
MWLFHDRWGEMEVASYLQTQSGRQQQLRFRYSATGRTQRPKSPIGGG